MNRVYLGETIDIHAGGQDLIFPHHENEIAQSEAATGKPFAHYWMHNGFINVDNKKMSKSAHNFFTVREIAQVYGYEPIRYLMLQAHYRMPLNYTAEILEQCKASLERMYNCRDSLKLALEKAASGAYTDEQKAQLEGFRERFCAAMDDDLNTADAISVVFDCIKSINLAIADGASKEYLTAASAVFEELIGVLGLLYERKEAQIPDEVMELVERRAAAKKQKDYATADAIRAQILELGYQLEETRQGLKIKPTRG
jgi:cysteinyl-tRNA synthetase